MDTGRRMGLGSLWDCVQGQPSWSLCLFVPPCPAVSLDAKSHKQPDHLCLYTQTSEPSLYSCGCFGHMAPLLCWKLDINLNKTLVLPLLGLKDMYISSCAFVCVICVFLFFWLACFTSKKVQLVSLSARIQKSWMVAEDKRIKGGGVHWKPWNERWVTAGIRKAQTGWDFGTALQER